MQGFNRRQKPVIKLILTILILLFLVAGTSSFEHSASVAVAMAKSKQMLDMNAFSAPELDIGMVQTIASSHLASEWASNTADTTSLEFVNAVPLTPGEVRNWQDAGCDRGGCAHVTYYDHEQGGTVESIISLATEAVVAIWTNDFARPAGSSWIMPRALSIAAADAEVQSLLGDIGAADPAMVPMSGWLADNNCSIQWCVDLTYHDPNGTGKIVHVFVNMESDRVERTFLSRARPERSAAEPLAQRDAYTDGCHEESGWEVCWEMTANDGVDFQNATYDGRTVFSSAKIGQVEAWYPSWPGGYRDEIGFSASVAPLGDTVITDLENGFEIRQFFTEFERWPNCICCYRYEQALKFYGDGAVEFIFVSHGPGCDDLSIYRPFWRIDVDLDGPENDQAWLWEDFSWKQRHVEFETFPIVNNLSPEGQKLGIVDGDLNYRWSMIETDPLNRDEGYFFLLQVNENEGEGPILSGPGDTYIPPRQWINGDSIDSENIVIWHVPMMKTIKSDPWWCMPDPEPDFSPCEAILRAEPAGEFDEPTPIELATMQSIISATPEAGPTSTAAPVPTRRPVDGTAAEEIVLNAGCTSCHKIGVLGEAHKVGPDLSTIGLSAHGRVPGMSGEAYIRQSILDPNAYLAPECPNGACMANVMPRDYDAG